MDRRRFWPPDKPVARMLPHTVLPHSIRPMALRSVSTRSDFSAAEAWM